MANRLADETSPYLLQHKDNPVDWYPWGEAAFSAAAAGEMPILISIGYSACHWCHVMEKESFEDPRTAAEMNRSFVCVKVDREERPDVDAVYMDFVQASTGHGGWPMTVFATPDGRPFYGGTYFPPDDRHGLPSFRRVLGAVAEAWRSRREEVQEQADRLTEHLREATAVEPGSLGDPMELLRTASDAAWASFDEEWGGFGRAPKFPQPMLVDLLLAEGARGDARAAQMATTTLDRMAAGGMFDQLGGGFARYSVDRTWTVPHFEKMLYDNAQLLRTYARSWLATGSERHAEVARSTAAWMLSEMRDPAGGFWSSLDADSEGEEGKFYIWSLDEVREAASDLSPLAEAAWGFSAQGNFEGSNIPVWTGDIQGEPGELEEARSRLLQARSRRVRPGTDDKVLLGWNALAAAALAEAGTILGHPEWVQAAQEAMVFLERTLKITNDGGGRFMRSYRAGKVGPHLAVAEDYAFFLDACLCLYEATFDPIWVDRAIETAGAAKELFWDEISGGFFTAGKDAEELVVRAKDIFDNAIPSANSAMAHSLTRLSLLTGDQSWDELAEGAMLLSAPMLERAPLGFGHLLSAIATRSTPAREIAIVGRGSEARELLAVVRETFVPYRVVASAEPGADPGPVGLLAGREAREGEATAYVCERGVCSMPVTTPDALRAQLTAA